MTKLQTHIALSGRWKPVSQFVQVDDWVLVTDGKVVRQSSGPTDIEGNCFTTWDHRLRKAGKAKMTHWANFRNPDRWDAARLVNDVL